MLAPGELGEPNVPLLLKPVFSWNAGRSVVVQVFINILHNGQWAPQYHDVIGPTSVRYLLPVPLKLP